MKKIWLSALCLAAVAGFSGCNESIQVDDLGTPVGSMSLDFSSHSLALSQANSCEDYRKHVLDSLARKIAYERFGTYGGYRWGWDVDYAEEPSASPDATNSGSKESAGDYTVTNVQEAGADELDSVKNDGTYMYSVQNNDVHITQVWPPEEMKDVSVIRGIGESKYSDMYVRGLMLSGDKLLVLGTAWTWNDDDDKWWYSESASVVNVYDVSDHTAPKLIKTHKVDGNIEDARLIKNRLHVVSSAEMGVSWYELYDLAVADIPGVPRFVSPWEDDDFSYDDWTSEQWDEYYDKQESWFDAREENIKKYLPNIRAWVEQKYSSMDDLKWPKYTDGTVKRDAVSCSDVYIPATSSQKDGLLLISEISGDNFENFSAKAVSDYGWLIYASTENLYVVSNSSYWWSDCMFDEKGCKPYSHIHHFNLGDANGQVKYVNSGEVEGMIHDQFWLSEYDGHLRVVSSPIYWWGNSPEGHSLSVYDVNTPSVMKLTGSVSGFGKDERVYSSRMFGKKGFVVSFRNTDPLFSFDLSDPNAPKLAGKLEIPGYSSYIHPVGENHLLTIGEDGDENGRLTGIQLQLFDVTDLAHPVQKYKTVIAQDISEDDYSSYGWSEAMYDHHAMNYHEKSGLLAVPINISSWTAYNYHHFSGMLIYKITPDTDFELIGGVDHADLVNNERYWWTNLDRARFYFKDAGVYDKNAYVYTISGKGIKVNDANNPKNQIAVVEYE